MLSETERHALEDIRDNIARAMCFVHGLDLDGFLRDDKTFYAATRCLEIISERPDICRRLSRNGFPKYLGRMLPVRAASTDITTKTFRSGESGKRFMKPCPRFAPLSI
jgi:hypothetical protein